MKTTLKNILGAAAAVLLVASGAAHAQTFGTEVRVSNQAGPSITPNIAATGTNVYLVWQENIPLGGGGFDGEIHFRRSADNGATWQPAINISNAPARQDLAPIIAAAGTTVAVFWTNDSANGNVFYSFSTNSGASFSAPVQITATAGYSRPSGALVDSGGRVHLTYYDNTANGQAYGEVYHTCATTPAGAFTTPVNVFLFDGVVDNETPRLAQAADGKLMILYRTSRNGLPQGGWPPFDTYMARTNTAPVNCTISNTQTGSPPVYWVLPAQKVSKGLPEELVNSYGGLFVTGNAGRVHAAWWNDRLGTNLIYRRGVPEGAGWGAPVDISRLGANHLQWDGAGAELGGFGLGEDASNHTHFVFADRTSTFDGYPTGNLFYTCMNSAGTLQAKVSAKSTGAAQAMQPRGLVNNGVFHMVWSDFRDAAAAITSGAEIYYRPVTVNSCSVVASPQAGVSLSSVNFGGQSMGTSTPSQPVTITNIGTGTLTISGISTTNAQFTQTNNCTSLASGASCVVDIVMTPAPAGGALNSTSPATGNLTITSNGAGSPNLVALSGTGEKSLVTHYYRSILRRAPDGGGLGFWVSQLNAGMPREVVLVSFMLSTEFTTFAQGIFGNTAARAEVDTVGDFFRGLLSRLPDSSGFNFWVQQFRTAQCTGAGAVYTQVESISSAFANGAEYAGRGRTNPQYVGDLYNSFLRRGGDLAGVQFWINQLDTAALTRNQVRQQFISSGEFTNRVNAIIAQGCVP